MNEMVDEIDTERRARYLGAMQVSVPPLRGRGARRHEAARRALIDVLWDRDGRRLPSERELARAIAACRAEDVWWVCEANSAGPLYLLPTREWIRALAKRIDAWRVRSVLEVAAGDGFLTACLAAARPRLEIRATDDGSWRRAEARAEEKSDVAFAGLALGPNVEKKSATSAVNAYRPDLTIVSWAPPGRLVERVIEASSRLVLDIGADGDVCGDDARTWRYHKEFLDGPIETRAFCRLDHGGTRRTRVTLYYGARHPEHSLL